MYFGLYYRNEIFFRGLSAITLRNQLISLEMKIYVNTALSNYISDGWSRVSQLSDKFLYTLSGMEI